MRDDANPSRQYHDLMLKLPHTELDDPAVYVTLDSQSPTSPVFDPSDLLAEVVAGVLAGFASSPWPAGVVGILVLTGIVRVVRGVIHGRHRRDPRRRFSPSDRATIITRAGSRCEQYSWLLGRCSETENLQGDHVHPHSRGGATALDNGQALCRKHNKQKSARVPWNWELARLERRRLAYFPPGVSGAVMRHRNRLYAAEAPGQAR